MSESSRLLVGMIHAFTYVLVLAIGVAYAAGQRRSAPAPWTLGIVVMSLMIVDALAGLELTVISMHATRTSGHLIETIEWARLGGRVLSLVVAVIAVALARRPAPSGPASSRRRA